MSQPVVSIDNLVKRYGENVAVDHFSLKIEEGEILGLLGPNGSGKTTTINCLLSLLSFDKGDIKIWGKEMSPSAYDIKSQIGVVMQNVAVIETLNVYENVDFFCGLYINDKKLRKQYVEEALEFTGLTEYKKQKPKKLSGGLLRRLNIACGIAHKPKLVIFDEPTVAVDPQSRNAILEGIKSDAFDGRRQMYILQVRASRERTIANLPHALGDIDCNETGTSHEGAIPNHLQRRKHLYGMKALAITKGRLRQGSHRGRNNHVVYLITSLERTTTYRLHPNRQIQHALRISAGKGIISDFLYSFRELRSPASQYQRLSILRKKRIGALG